jgi:hypothetical protein
MKLLSSPSAFPYLAIALAATATLSQPTTVTPSATAVATYGKLPLSFEANHGQAVPSVDFLSHGPGYALFLRSGEAFLAIHSGTSVLSPDRSSRDQSGHASAPMPLEGSVVGMRWIGANSRAYARAEDELITKTNYFLGNDPADWRTNIPNYGRVRYRSIYPGIDLVFYGNQRQLEHDFVVSPHANPSKIVLSLTGIKDVQIDPATGDLIASTGTAGAKGDLRLIKPTAYQLLGGHRTAVAVQYQLLADNQIAFVVGHYDRSAPLTIDPVLVYSTYLGGSGLNGNGDQGNGIAVDSAGNAYVVGTTYSTNFPVTGAAFQSQNNAALAGHGSTVFVTKLNATGTALVYSTYLGGSGSSSGGDFGYGIALDSLNNAYITGATYSTDFPVTCGAYQTANPSTTSGATTAFVSKLTADGSALTYSTYLGGSGNQASPAQGDVAQAIVADASGNAYVTGYTSSSNFPVTDGAFQTQYAGSTSTWNAFVTKLNPSGTSLVYSTYLGGSGSPPDPNYYLPAAGDYGNAIAIDASGDAFVAGSTASSNFPVTTGAFQTTLAGPSNGFVTKLNPAGTEEVYSTYLGGSGQTDLPFYTEYPYVISSPFVSGDSANAIAVDNSGFAYIAGNTTSNDFPVSAGVLEGASDVDSSAGFVAKLKQDGSALEYSTYLEGIGTSVSGLAVDSTGNAYLTGNAPAVSAGFPAGFQSTPDALATPASSGVSAFLVKLNPSATVLNYATLLGGSSNDKAASLALDAEGNVYLTGSAYSTNFPTTTGAFQTSENAAAAGGSNAFISKFALAGEANQTTYPALPSGSTGATLTDDGGSISLQCYPDAGSDTLSITVNLALTTQSVWPPPTGTVSFVDSLSVPPAIGQGIAVLENPAATLPPIYLTFNDGWPFDGPISPFTVSWSATYSGDAVYAPSSVSGSVSTPGCSSSTSVAGQASKGHALRQSGSPMAQGTSPSQPALHSVSAKLGSTGPKFSPPAVQQGDGQKLPAISSVKSQATPACIAPAQAATPAFSLAAGTYTSAQSVTITDTTTDAAIYYTTDGTTPTTSSTQYASPITVSATETIEAIAVATGYANSAVASATYTINLPLAAAPVFSPAAGTYTSAQSVAITDATTGAAIYYTTNGTMPTMSSTMYMGPITVSATETIEAIAVATGYSTSAVASATYTINLPPQSFSITVSPTSLTIAPGQSGTATISITPQNGFASPTTFSCSGLPPGASCSFSPSTVTPSGGVAATTTLTVSASESAKALPYSPPLIPGATLAIAFCCLGWKKRRAIQLLLLVAAAASFGTSLLIGCGGKPTPKPVTSSVTVIAKSGTIQQTVPLTVTIQ